MTEPSTIVTCDADLEAVVGARPGVVMLKSIRFLDEHCEGFLGRSPCAVIGTTTADGALQAIVRSGEPGLAVPRSDTALEIGEVGGEQLIDGAPAGLLALVPGYGETLRVNGRLHLHDGVATLAVEEALLHCAKATMRSELWTAPVVPTPTDGGAPPSIETFLAGAPFAVLVSTDADGHADVSPRGDPPGLIRRIDDTTVAIAERPGNRRTDTLHNLMSDPRIALLAMTPGSAHVAEICGTAQVCTDPEVLTSMRLRDRTPKAAILVEVERSELRAEPALATALWDPTTRTAEVTLPPAATIWADHVRRNTDAGTGARLARRLVNRTALAAGVAMDYWTNL